MNPLEERLRDAYRAAADTVRPETVLPGGVGGLDRDGHPATRPGRRGWSRSPLLVPLAAAVALTVVVATAYVLGSQLFARQGGGRPAAPTTPAFFVAHDAVGQGLAHTRNAATGTPGASIRVPFKESSLVGVATGDGRTFVAAEAEPHACQTALYRFAVAADGTPTTLTRFATVPGLTFAPWLAVLGNGRTIVYVTTGCGHPLRGQVRRGYLAMVNTATGQTKRWTLTAPDPIAVTSRPPCYGDVSLSASERTISFCNRVVPTSAAPGPWALRGRILVRHGEFGHANISGMELNPDGKTAYVAITNLQHNKPAGRNWQLFAIDLSTGQTRLIRSFPGTPGPSPVTADPTGRYLLVEYDPPPARLGHTRLARLDLKTGRLTPAQPPGGRQCFHRLVTRSGSIGQIAITPDGKTAYVTTASGVTVVSG